MIDDLLLAPFIFFSLVHAVPGVRPARQTCGKECCNTGATPEGRVRRLTVIGWRRLPEPQCCRYAECGLQILRYPAQRRTEIDRLQRIIYKRLPFLKEATLCQSKKYASISDARDW